MAKATLEPQQEDTDWYKGEPLPPSDEGMGFNTGIGKDEERAIDQRASTPLSEKANQDSQGVYESSGNEPSTITGKRVADKKNAGKKPATDDELAKAEKNGAGQTQADLASQAEQEKLGGGADSNSLYKQVETPRPWFRFRRPGRRATIGGGIAGGIVGLVMLLTLSSGPLQFIHISQLLRQFHYSSLENEQDNRLMHSLRYARNYTKGTVERTRMGLVGNKLADVFENKLAEKGLVASYSRNFGLAEGYVLDRASPKSPYYKMSKDEAIAAAKKNLGESNLVFGEDTSGRPMVTIPEGYANAYKSNYALFKAIGLDAKASAVGTGLMTKRAGISWHPTDKWTANVQSKIEKAATNSARKKITDTETAAKEDAYVTRGFTTEKITATGASKDPKTTTPQEQAAINDAVTQTNELSTTAEKTGLALKKGSTTAISDLKTGIKSGVTKGTFLIALVCSLKTIDNHAPALKQTGVYLPLMRMGGLSLSQGGNFQNGFNVNLDQMNYYASQLKDSSGKTWYSAASIQGELGNADATNANKYVQPDDTLKSLNDVYTPFHFLNTGTTGSITGAACGLPGQVIGFAVTIFTAGTSVVAQLATAPIQGYLIGQGEDVTGRWLAGNPISPNDEALNGPQRGNYINYGALLASNDQALSLGGVKLTDQQAVALRAIDQTNQADQFNSQSIAYKLLNTHDSHSAVSKLIDQSSNSFSSNLARLGSAIIDIPKAFGSLTKIFSKPAAAASSGYNYGIQKVGFSETDMNNPDFANPYANAEAVVNLLESKDGNKYIAKAQRCFGAKIYKDASGVWGVTSDANSSPNQATLKDDCASDPDSNWLKVRFFIMDTITIDGAGCYENVDGSASACADLGFDQPSDTTATTAQVSAPASSTSTTPAANSQANASVVGSFTPVCSNYMTVPTVTSYGWPITPFDQQHAVRANLNDPRFSGSKDIDTADSQAFHFGIDISADDGTPVYAIEPGEVHVSGGQSISIVSADKMLDYWHIDYTGIVSNGDKVKQHQLIGHVATSWGHVHLAESHRGPDGKVYYVNPLRAGALTPYKDNTAPAVSSLSIIKADGTLDGTTNITNTVDLVVNAYDTPPIKPPKPWDNAILSPATISWSVSDAQGNTVMDTKMAEDFGKVMCSADILDQIYATGTIQNSTTAAGNYNYYLIKNWDTTKMPNGVYSVSVTATDTGGNKTTKIFSVKVNN